MHPGSTRHALAAGRVGKTWTVALLSDDLALGQRLAEWLDHADFHFSCARAQGIDPFAGSWATFDLVLLYVSRERANGSMAREILRKHQGCVVVLGRPATGMERAWWIENGADDCLSHPCDKQELLARLRASIRRRQRQPGANHARTVTVGALTLSLGERTASLSGQEIVLTTCEFALLATLAAHAGEVLDRERLLEFAKGSAEQAFERSIDVQISRLRAKLGDNSREPRMLKTVRGAGYVLVAAKSKSKSKSKKAASPRVPGIAHALFQNVSTAKASTGK
jgi:two-component system, OmpR family, response regulator